MLGAWRCSLRCCVTAAVLWLCALPAAFAQDDELDFLLNEPDSSAPAGESNDNSSAAKDDGEESSASRPSDTDAITLAPERIEPAPKPVRSRVLEEIIVTAQKREQSLTDVPISVSAVSGDKLRDAGIENLSDLSEYAPNFKLVEGGLVPLIYMRGVGSGSNQGFEMSVGLYNDGIHLGRPHQTLAAFLDVERIEVLKGPQSILFGKNAIAGAMSITSAKPQDDFAANVSASWFEPFQDRELSGFVTGGLSENINGRLAFRLRDEGGYVFNLTQQRKDPQLQEVAGRGTLQWEPADSMRFNLKFERSSRDATGRTYQIIDNGILTDSANKLEGLNDTRDTNEDEYMSLLSDSVTLNSELDFGEHTLQLVSGFSQYDQTDGFDGDSSSIDTVFLNGREDYSQFSQEVRWVSPPGDTVDFIVGAFYQQAEQVFNEAGPLKVRSGTLQFAVLPGELIDLVAQLGPLNTVTVVSADLARLFTVDSESSSVFAQATWHFATDWRLTGRAICA